MPTKLTLKNNTKKKKPKTTKKNPIKTTKPKLESKLKLNYNTNK